MTGLLALSGGELDLDITIGAHTSFTMAVIDPVTREPVPLAPSIYTGNILDAHSGGSILTSFNVTEEGGLITVALTVENSQLMAPRQRYPWMLVQYPEDEDFGPYPIAYGDVHTRELI